MISKGKAYVTGVVMSGMLLLGMPMVANPSNIGCQQTEISSNSSEEFVKDEERLEERIRGIIEERKKEALEKDFFTKGDIIADQLGKLYSRDYEDSETLYKSNSFIVKQNIGRSPGLEDWTTIQVYYKKSLVFKGKEEKELIIESGEGKVEVEYRDELVVSVKAYVPGEWEKEFEYLYLNAKIVEKEKQRSEQETKMREKSEALMEQMKNFGIDPEF